MIQISTSIITAFSKYENLLELLLTGIQSSLASSISLGQTIFDV